MIDPTLYHPRPERWPQFTLRGLFIAVTLVAFLTPQIPVVYRSWENQQRRYRRIRAFEEATRHTGRIRYCIEPNRADEHAD